MKIRKVAVLVVICFLLPFMAFGFDLAVGIKGGVGLPHFWGPDYQDLLDSMGISTQLKLGYSGGVFVTIGLFDLLAIQPEAHYALMGGRFGDNTGSVVYDAPVIQIPVLAKGRLRAGSLTITAFAGPSLMFKIGKWNNELRDADGNVVASGEWTEDEVTNLIFGVVAGAGFELPVAGGVVSLEARYLLGITPLFVSGTVSYPDIRQNNLQVLVGYGLPLIK